MMSERHLAVEFTHAGPVLHYRAEKAAAEEFAAAARRQSLVHRVTIDDKVSTEMTQLPYQRLFQP
ncbi:hypothetical protein ACIBG0_41395 [Nocardia sp. NPDC050630]|uniref:hypothetical protein n=1 Tax=Nocardia sp. NPDC050630 TaxID=3364321 RepID=UPI00379A5B07